MKGRVKFFNEMKGFGFIAGEGEDEKEYFVHQSDLGEGVTLHENDVVTFDVEEGDRGPKAVNVKKEEESSEEPESEESSEESGESNEEQESEE